MKQLASITGDNGERISLSYDAVAQALYQESAADSGGQIGPEFATEADAVAYIQDSWSRGWDLAWKEEEEETK